VNAEDFEFEELGISKSVGLAFHRFDLVVRAFQGAGRDRVVVSGQNPSGVQSKHRHVRGFGIGDPLQQARHGRLLIILLPDLVEFFFQKLGDGQRFVQLERLGKTLGFFLARYR
jgi:hypothetical protein